MAAPRLDDPLWEDAKKLRAELARAGLITLPKDRPPELRTFGWQALVALAAIAERYEGTEHPSLQRVLNQVFDMQFRG